MKQLQRQQLSAMVVTVVFHLFIVVMLTVICLRYDPSAAMDREWPPVDSAEILLGGEYVLAGDIPDGSVTDSPAETVQEPEPAETSDAEATAAYDTESPAKTVTTPVSTEKPKVDPAAEQRAREQQQTREQTASRVSGAFSATAQKDKPKAGSTNGNSTTGGSSSGAPGVDVGNRTLASWVSARGNAVGTITIDVTVNREGRVTAASYNPGRSKGAVAASESARQSCLNAARQCRFSKAVEGPELQRGTISFKFK